MYFALVQSPEEIVVACLNGISRKRSIKKKTSDNREGKTAGRLKGLLVKSKFVLTDYFSDIRMLVFVYILRSVLPWNPSTLQGHILGLNRYCDLPNGEG